MVAYAPCVEGVQNLWLSLGRGMVVVDPGSPSSGALIRKQLVGCILLHGIF